MTSRKQYLLKSLNLLIVSTALSISSFIQAGSLNDSRQLIEISRDNWLIQPADSPKKGPDNKQWERCTITGWMPGKVHTPKKSWAKKKNCWEDYHSYWYKKEFQVPADWTGKRILLDFNLIQSDIIVYINDNKVGELLRPGGEMVVTDFLKLGQNNVLRVFMTRDYTGISRGFDKDYYRKTKMHRFGSKIPMKKWDMGIRGRVKLIALPTPASVIDVYALPSWRQKTLTLKIEILSESAVKNVSIHAGIVDEKGKSVLTLKKENIDLPSGISEQTLTVPWKNPIPWEFNAPYLYKTYVELKTAGKTIDKVPPVTFGFKEVWRDGKQIMMNGHPSHWRIDFMRGVKAPGLSMFRDIGYNMLILSHYHEERPFLDEKLLEQMDRDGVGVICPTPTISYLRNALNTEPGARKEFDRLCKLAMKRYRNHPSIMAWYVAVNSFCPLDNIAPQQLGKKMKSPTPQSEYINTACNISRKYDAKSLAYSHADGSTGDLSTSNIYLNFAPLQEREEWLMEWAKNGDFPYHAAEFGQPYSSNFWKGKNYLMTEYLSMYFGDNAYQTEKVDGLKKTIKHSLANTNKHACFIKNPIGKGFSVDLSETPLFWEFQRLFIGNINKSWRLWGLNGGLLYFDADTAYGDPPNARNIYTRYRNITKPLSGKPDWASPNYEIHQQYNKDLMITIVGYPRHTFKDHDFFSGELIQKQIGAIWDGPGQKNVIAAWKLIDPLGETIAHAEQKISLSTGDINFYPIRVKAPTVMKRTDYQLLLRVHEGSAILRQEAFTVTVFPKYRPIITDKKIAVYDPKGKSLPWLKKLGLTPIQFSEGTSLKEIDLLIIGREALTPGASFPYTAGDIKNGLKVIILEQKPEAWKAAGFDIIDTMPRYVFPRDWNSPILAGLKPADLINWRGAPDLTEEGKNGHHDTQRAPKWTNTHTVATVALKVPEVVGFTPILATEFDMNYSPLLEWRYGKGLVYNCSLDFTNRVGRHPLPTLVARNLIMNALTIKPFPTKQVYYAGDANGRKLLKQLQVSVAEKRSFEKPAESIIVIGSSQNDLPKAQLDSFCQNGGTLLYLPQKADILSANGLTPALKSVYRVPLEPHPILRGVGLNQTRWRDYLKVNTITGKNLPGKTTLLLNGLLAIQSLGKGKKIYCQFGPELLAKRYADDKDKAYIIRLSVSRLYQLLAAVLTNAGASPAKQQADRLTFLDMGNAYRKLTPWTILGPFPVKSDNSDLMLNTVFPGESAAIKGDTNVNDIYTRQDGKRLDWRTIMGADANSFVDLNKICSSDEALTVSYAVCRLHSETAREADLMLGVDWRLKAWVNGKLVFKTKTGCRGPRFKVRIKLKKGENIVTLKVGSGSQGNGFWAIMSKPGKKGGKKLPKRLKDWSLYNVDTGFDPYLFHYW